MSLPPPFNVIRARSRGVSLIELMVALAIGGLLIAGAVTVYMQSRNTYRTSDTAARMQEVARYALDTITPDIRLAGFWGMTNNPDPFTNTVTVAVADDCGANWAVNTTQEIAALDAAASGGPGYTLTCAGMNPVAWSDVLIVRRASSDVAALEAGRIQVQSNRVSATLFSTGTLPAGFTTPGESETRNLLVSAYYVGEVLPSPNGVRQFTLRRQTLIRTSGGAPAIRDEEIIPGVEDLQVQFGIDTNGDGNTDRYVDPDDVPAGARIAAAQIWLLVIAEEREIGFVDDNEYEYANADHGPFNDDRRRVLVSKTIQIRNAT